MFHVVDANEYVNLTNQTLTNCSGGLELDSCLSEELGNCYNDSDSTGNALGRDMMIQRCGY